MKDSLYSLALFVLWLIVCLGGCWLGVAIAEMVR